MMWRVMDSQATLEVAGAGPERHGFPKSYRLSQALDILRQVNALICADGTPLPDRHLLEGHSLWSFWQNYLYEMYLKPYTRYREFFAWQREQGWPEAAPGSRIPKDLGRVMSQMKRWRTGELSERPDRVLAMGSRLIPWAWAASSRLSRSKVLLYSPDLVSDARHGCDFRFAKIYGMVAEAGIARAEVFHSLGLRRSLANAWMRRRIALYPELWQHEGLPPARADFDLLGFEPPLRDLLAGAIPYFLSCARISAGRVAGLRRTLRLSGVRALLAMDDFRASNELLLACRLEGIRTVLVQHGLITRFHPGWFSNGIPHARMVMPDHYLVRSPFWKGVLEHYGSHLAPCAEVVSGLDETGPEEAAPKAPPPSRKLTVLLLLETLWEPVEAAAFVQKLLEDDRIEVRFKIRPDMGEEEQVRPYFGPRKPHKVVRDLESARADVDVILGSHSSLLYKLLEWNRPIFRMVTSFEYGEQLSRFGMVEELRLEDDFHSAFARARGQSPGVFAERLGRFRGDGGFPHYADRIKSLLEDVL